MLVCPAVSEFALVRQAFYTEPADQSGWLYHRWLLGRVAQRVPTLPALLVSLGHNDMDGSDSGELPSVWQSADGIADATAAASVLGPLAVFSRELAMCRELDGIEPNCKWVLLTTALLVAGRDAISRRQQQHSDGPQQRQRAFDDGSPEGSASAMEESVAAELSSLFGRLILLDPLRTNYYRDVHASFTNRRDELNSVAAAVA